MRRRQGSRPARHDGGGLFAQRARDRSVGCQRVVRGTSGRNRCERIGPSTGKGSPPASRRRASDGTHRGRRSRAGRPARRSGRARASRGIRREQGVEVGDVRRQSSKIGHNGTLPGKFAKQCSYLNRTQRETLQRIAMLSWPRGTPEARKVPSAMAKLSATDSTPRSRGNADPRDAAAASSHRR